MIRTCLERQHTASLHSRAAIKEMLMKTVSINIDAEIECQRQKTKIKVVKICVKANGVL